jgi:hypothetical protein
MCASASWVGGVRKVVGERAEPGHANRAFAHDTERNGKPGHDKRAGPAAT